MNRLKITFLVLAVIGLVVAGLGLSDSIKIFKGDSIKIEDTKMGELETGDLVTGKLDYVLDEVAVETTKRSYGGIPTGSSKTPFYLVIVNSGTDNARYMVVSVGNETDQKDYEKAADEFWDSLTEDGDVTAAPCDIELTTKVVEMPDKVNEYLTEYCKEGLGLTDADIADVVENTIVLSAVKYEAMKWIPFIGVGIFVVFLLAFIIYSKKTKG